MASFLNNENLQGFPLKYKQPNTNLENIEYTTNEKELFTKYKKET